MTFGNKSSCLPELGSYRTSTTRRQRRGVALTLHRVLNSLKVENFIKTSGQTGMRLMVPLAAKYDGGP
jgi:DNA primase